MSADPVILSKQRDIEAKLAVVSSNKAQKDFQVGTTIYGGIEDITENTKGVALSLNASRLVFDGGKTDAQIESALFSVEAAKMDLRATADQRALELCQIWLELERYKTLKAQIDERLNMLT